MNRLRYSQAGLSLVELMIAMVLGLLLTAGVIQLLIGSRQTYGVLVAQSSAQENGRIGVFFMDRAIKQAGYWDRPLVPLAYSAHLNFGIDASIWGENNDSSVANVLDGTDYFEIRYSGTADGSIQSCIGSEIDADEMAVDRYYVGTLAGSEQIPSLYCWSRVYQLDLATGQVLGAGALINNPQPLVAGIENMQVLYGVGDFDVVSQYFVAGDVADWRLVRSVQIGLLAASNEETGGVQNAREYDLLDEVIPAANDRRPRQVYAATVSLRNYRGK